jgi:sterol desaturase/sphingolipid hydroxylase (fatty acid hydroxylase superfamily)
VIAGAIGEALIGWLVADFLSGVFHWWQDRLTSPRWRIIGPWLIEPSRLHHRQPRAFLAGSFLRRNGPAFALVVGVGAAWLALFGPTIALASAIVGGALTTQVHYWTHRPSIVGPFLRVLQETGVLQSPKHHAGHHRPPQDRRYCALTDWLNPTLDALDVWGRLERLGGRR